MPQPYQFILVDAPIKTVWDVIQHDAEQHGHVITIRKPDLLEVQSEDLFSVYGLRPYPKFQNKTGVYLVTTHDQAAAADLVNAPDLFHALETMPVDITPDEYKEAQARLQDIEIHIINEEDKCHKAETDTRIAASSSLETNIHHASGAAAFSDLNKVTIPRGQPVVRLTTIWVLFILLYPLTGMFSALALLTLNWFSLGKNFKAVSVFVVSLVTYIITASLISMGLARLNLEADALFVLTVILQIAATAGIVLWQVTLQAPDYDTAVYFYGKPSGWAWKNVALTIAALIIGGTIRMGLPSALRTFFPGVNAFVWFMTNQVYKDERITLSYPNRWRPTTLSNSACSEPSVDCPLIVGNLQGNEGLMLAEAKNVFGIFTTLEGASYAIESDIEHIHELDPSLDGTHDVTILKFKIDGRSAIRHDAHYMLRIPGKAIKVEIVASILIIQDGDDLIRLDIIMPPQLSSTIDEIINSVHFVKPLEK